MKSRSTITVNVEARIEWVHMCPPEGSALTVCCGRSPFELPRWQRMTTDPLLVTCPLQLPPYEDAPPDENCWDDRTTPKVR